MNLGFGLLIFLVLLVGVFPAWPHSRGWGYVPSTGVGVAVLLVIVLVFSGRL